MRKNINLYQKYAFKIDKFKKKNRGTQFGCIARKSRTKFFPNNDIRTQFGNTDYDIIDKQFWFGHRRLGFNFMSIQLIGWRANGCAINETRSNKQIISPKNITEGGDKIFLGIFYPQKNYPRLYPR
jgi:hypothetical protein